MIIEMISVGKGDILAGAESGKAALLRLLERASVEPETPEPCFLNFSGVEVVTGSYLRESVLSFKAILRACSSNLYAVIANANQVIVDELTLVARAKSDAVLTCTIDETGAVESWDVIGDLDPKQYMTFAIVNERGTADASSLMREYGQQEQTTRTTAWNNRLSALEAKGLISEHTQGRTKVYKPLLREMSYGL